MKRLSLAVIIIMIAASVYAGEEGGREEGLFSEGSFLSEVLASAAGKIDKVTSGEERIVDKNAKGIDEDTLEYDGDPLGRPNSTVTRNSLRDRRERMDAAEPF
ncbi:MAG: hypothetical protein PHX20_07540 [Candidatus Omnitrophica bacterium]|nr:hypothetical protein [Candidatus Omnitrophota bacterium]MDD5437377.1 hypothetical protein [Candidatus Omnitrophota bacterium]